MKILTLLASIAPRYGGPSKASLELAQALAARGHAMTIYTTNWDGPGELPVPLEVPVDEKGVKVWYFPIQFPRFWAFSAPLGRAIRDHIREFDLVHVYSLYFFHGWVTRHYCLKYGIPYVIQPHGTLDPYLYRRHRWRKFVAETLYENKNIRSAAALLYSSEEEGHIARGAVRGRPAGVVPAGLNLSDYPETWPRGRFRERYPETKNKQLVIFLSRVNFKKGIDLLVASFAALARDRPNVHLVIAGPDNEGYGERIRAQAVRNGIGKKITMTGMISEDQKRDAFADADLFALTSYTENFGMTVLEALACGLPALISDQVNIWREVVGAGAGVAVPCSVPEITRAMGALLDDPEKRRRMSENGRRLIRERFQWERVAEQHEVFFNAVKNGDVKDPFTAAAS